MPASGSEVREVTVLGTRFEVADSGRTARAFTIPTLEHCREELFHEVHVDGVSGAPVADGPAIITGPGRRWTTR